jgi:hypothetical protein
MDSFDCHSLNDDEMGRLVSIAMEEFGRGLAQTHFNDVMLARFEHIAGLETIPPKLARQYLAILWQIGKLRVRPDRALCLPSRFASASRRSSMG